MGIIPKSLSDVGEFVYPKVLEEPIGVGLANNEDSVILIESYIVIPRIKVSLIHGIVAVDNVEIGICNEGFDNCNHIILGVPFLHFLHALPVQILEKYATQGIVFGKSHVPLSLNINSARLAVLSKTDFIPKKLCSGVIENENIWESIVAAENNCIEDDDDGKGIKEPVPIPEFLRNNFHFNENEFQSKDALLQEMAEQVASYKVNKEGNDEGRLLNDIEFMNLILEFTNVLRTAFGGDPCANVTPMPFEYDDKKNKTRPCSSYYSFK